MSSLVVMPNSTWYARNGDVAAQAEQLEPCRLSRTKLGEGLTTVPDDARDGRQCLDIVDEGRRAEKTCLGWKWRLLAWLSTESLDRVEERCLLTAYVSASTTTNLDVDTEI